MTSARQALIDRVAADQIPHHHGVMNKPHADVDGRKDAEADVVLRPGQIKDPLGAWHGPGGGTAAAIQQSAADTGTRTEDAKFELGRGLPTRFGGVRPSVQAGPGRL